MLDASGRQVELAQVLRTHSVIEASAGTGKTYTIEHLVALILKQHPDVALENILLVTFTEKAAGELKERIRSHLEDEVAGLEGDIRSRFESAIENFDLAAIYTIHGFCHRVLMEFAFENNRPFELEMGSDSSSRSRLLADVIRSGWPGLFTAPDTDAIITQVLKKIGSLRSVADQLRADDVLLPGDDGVLSSAGPTPAAGRASASAAVSAGVSAATLSAWTVRKLVARARDAGRASSVLTFQDMISGVRDALSESNPSRDVLLAILRKRFRFALVDEFQDTDPDQWSIFRQIFVDGKGANRLMVVGDPKQAIYGFRGADVQTYLDARARICGNDRIGLFRLDTNYRSSPELINGFNHIFSADGWFDVPEGGRTTGGIRYDESAVPADPARHKRFLSDCSGRAAVVPVTINGPGEEQDKISAPLARSRLANFIADEVLRLVDNGRITLKDPDTGEPRRLGYGDICVLARSKTDVKPVIRALRERRIPNAFYKQTGLYHSAEAFQTLTLLRTLAASDGFDGRSIDPKVRLTRFFSSSNDLSADLARADAGEYSGVLVGWRDLAVARNWPMLFESVMSDTGLLMREALHDDGERRIANWRQIFSELSCEADRASLDIHGLVAHLEFRRGNYDDEKDSDLHRLESEQPKVRVMTIHAAKGLQFPVVFVASGFSADSQSREGYVRGYEDGRRKFIFTQDPKQAPNVRSDDDSNRLYYVAMTRAMYRLYFPVNWTPSRPGRIPITTFIRNGFERLRERTEAGQVWTIVDTSGETVKGAAPVLLPENDLNSGTSVAASPEFDLSVSLPVNFATRRMWIDSYTSLKGLGSRSHYVVEGLAPDRTDDDNDVSATADSTDALELTEFQPDSGIDVTAPTARAKELLRGGTAVGSAFHQVMEQIASQVPGKLGRRACFTDAAALIQSTGIATATIDSSRTIASAILEGNYGVFIEDAMKMQGIPALERRREGRVVDSAALQFAGLVANALTTPLFADNATSGIRVCDVPSVRTIAEMEFHLDESDPAIGISGLSIPAWRRGLLNGFIDVVFSVDGLYYFLDWKTTRLSASPTVPDPYSGLALDSAMAEHGYIIQSHVYSLALMRWLQQRFGVDGAARFGGGFFLFVRGMDAPGRGVWNCVRQYGPADVADSAALVGRLLGQSAARFAQVAGGLP